MTAMTAMRIGGARITTEATISVRSPFDGSEVGRVPDAGTDHLDAAVAAALDRHRRGALPAHERAAILDRAAALLTERTEAFALLIAREAAKPIRTARVEAARAVDTFRFAAATARTLTGETVPLDASSAGEGKLGVVVRHPIGVVAGISPFNFPLNLVAHKVAPAIAAGAPLVLKPATATPLTALALADLLLDECGLPPGWLNVVTARGNVANHLVEHEDVAMITFTGSPDVGWGIRSRAPRKKVNLELGNNSPVIVEADGDWKRAADKIGVAGYAFAGQSCISVQRIYAHHSIVDDFLGALVPAVESLHVGDPLDEKTDVSALIDASATDRVRSWIDEAVTGGAEIVAGGSLEGRVLRPTVLTGVTPKMKVCADEVFGPLVSVTPYDTLEQAIELANDTRYGLQAGLFTSRLSSALRAADALRFGGVTVNEVPTWRADHMPYGGVGDSGNTREGPAYAAEEMTEPRLVTFEP